MGFLTFMEYTWNMYGICVYIYTEYVKNVIYGIFGVSHFYMAYVWNLGFHTYMGFLTFYVEYTWNMYGICVCIYIYMEYVWNAIYGIYVVSHFLCGIYMEYVYIYM